MMKRLKQTSLVLRVEIVWCIKMFIKLNLGVRTDCEGHGLKKETFPDHIMLH